jgi:hypothetical protein
MQVQNIQAVYGVTINVGDGNNVKIEVGLSGVLEGHDDYENCTRQLRLIAEREVDLRVSELRAAGVRVDPAFIQKTPSAEVVELYSEGRKVREVVIHDPALNDPAEESTPLAIAPDPTTQKPAPQSEEPAAPSNDIEEFAKKVMAACLAEKGNEKAAKAYYETFMRKQPVSVQMDLVRKHTSTDSPTAVTTAAHERLKGLVATLVERGTDVTKIDEKIAHVCDGESKIHKLSPEQIAKAENALNWMLRELKQAEANDAA